MHPRGKPLFQTSVAGDKLHGAVKEFWQELNESKYVNESMVTNLGPSWRNYN